MVKIIYIIIIIQLCGCGKEGEIPWPNTLINKEPAKIDEERIYKF